MSNTINYVTISQAATDLGRAGLKLYDQVKPILVAADSSDSDLIVPAIELVRRRLADMNDMLAMIDRQVYGRNFQVINAVQSK